MRCWRPSKASPVYLNLLLKTPQIRHPRGNFFDLSWVLKDDIIQVSCVTPVFVSFIVTVNRHQTRSDLMEKNSILSQGVRGHIPQRQRRGVCIRLYQKGEAVCLHISIPDAGVGGQGGERGPIYHMWLGFSPQGLPSSLPSSSLRPSPQRFHSLQISTTSWRRRVQRLELLEMSLYSNHNTTTLWLSWEKTVKRLTAQNLPSPFHVSFSLCLFTWGAAF